MSTLALALCAALALSAQAADGRKWAGAKVSILGDSYSTFAGVSGDPLNNSLPAGDTAGCKEFENNPFYPGDVSIQESETWWRQVLESLGGTLDKNNSVGGSEITRDVGNGANIPKDGRNLIRSFVHRAAELGSPDVILVFGGTNDGWDGLGRSEFKNGVTTLFAALKSGYPDAQVIVIVPAQANDSSKIAGISADFRTVLLDGAAGSGFLSVDLGEVEFVSDDFTYGHPKAPGMTKIADKVIATVNAAPTLYKTLETDGRGYILTDYQPKTSRSRIEYDLRFLYLGLSVGLGIANGTSSSGAANDKEWGGYFNGENGIFTYYTEPGGAGMSFGAGFCDTSVRHTVAMGQGAVTFDGQTTAIATPADDCTTGGKFALFAVNYGGPSFSSRANVRVAGIRVFEDDTVVRSWVPAKDVNGNATLYDLVNKKFETVKAGVFSVDNTVDPTWEAQATNSWTVQPSVPPSVTAGTLPTISLGTAKYGNGTQTATYTAKDIQNLPAGTYTQVVEVKGTADYRGLRAEVTFTVTGTVPTAASVAPAAVAPLGGASVATHTAKQKEFIGLPPEVRKRVLSVRYERERAEYAANDGHPQPVRLRWNGGDGECTIKVYRGKETTPVQTHTVVTRWTDGNFLDVDNLEIGRAYRWTVTNAKGTAEGSFVTEDETPRLFNAGVVGNTRDLGGYVGLDGRRVRQGMFLRSRCFDTNKRATYASILTATDEAFFRDFIGLKTEIDLRGETWITQSFVPGVTTRVNTAWPLDYTGAYLTDATKRAAMKAALDPIFDATKYPIDVHCHSGQDRTGMYCFILEALLGVSEADCIRDWEWSALGNSGFNAGDTYQLDSFLAKFRSLHGATTQEKAEMFMKWVGYTNGQIATFRDIMLEPAEDPAALPAALVISEVCARCQPKAVPACKDLGWIELYNGADEAVNLKDYKLLVLNRGKKIDAAKNILPLDDHEVKPGEYALVYTSETFGNEAVAEVEDTFAGRGTITVCPKKINPKKYPFLQLFKAGADGDELLQTVVVPVDLADEKSYTTVPGRRILATPTPGAANVCGDGDIAYGPNISPLYGVKDAADPWRAFPQAAVGEDYAVSFPVNPADMSADGDDAIASVRLVYQIGFGGEVEGSEMTPSETNKQDGVVYTGVIPGAALAKAGQLVRFAARITDGAGRTFRSPSFANPDDGYEWYGTIVAPEASIVSPTLQTFHLFADAPSLDQMDIDADAQDRSVVPYNARVGVYDGQTGLYYDNVRIDLRGNTSVGFRKKSHGLRFNKAQPLTCENPFESGEDAVIKEVRKTSFVAEYGDPSHVRQSLSFRVFREMGLKTPFHYPVRLNLNGAFYQLAFHSSRFTDELIEDAYGLDPLGYAYKNVGTFQGVRGYSGAGDYDTIIPPEKKTPDDGDEMSEKAYGPLLDLIGELKSRPSDAAVRALDLPAWINYLAAARITSECDDVMANLSAYWDRNGTGLWTPLCYDLQLSWGQYSPDGDGVRGHIGSVATFDWFKSHPFYGGEAVRAHDDAPGKPGYATRSRANLAVEAVWRSAKFRRLYLRRLRTVMDRVLKAPGTSRAETPFWGYVTSVTNALAPETALDDAKWTPDGEDGNCAKNVRIYVWPQWLTTTEAVDDLWTNYIEPRRTHLYMTHSVHAPNVGYGADFAAGIPDAQRPTTELKAGFSVADRTDNALVIRNDNAEAVDMSGWTLTGAVAWTLPAGTVIDAHDILTVVADRRTFVAARGSELVDQVIVGNATFDAKSDSLVLADADGVTVLEFVPPACVNLGAATATPGVDFAGSTVVLALGDDFDARGREIAAKLTVAEDSVIGTLDLEAKTVTFVLDAEAAPRGALAFGQIELAVGDERFARTIVIEQGRTVVERTEEGWIRLGETEVEDGLVVESEQGPSADCALVIVRSELTLGAGEPFAPTDHAGVRTVETPGGCFCAFRTADGCVTNATPFAAGETVEVEMRLDYRRHLVAYVVAGETNGPYALPAAAVRANGVGFGGSGRVAYVNGDYEVWNLNTNVAAVGDAEYATVADAVAADGPVELLWDASWTPTAEGDYSFVTNGHELRLGGDLVFEVTKNVDGTVSVTVTNGAALEPKPATIELKDGKVVVGVANPDPKRMYGLARAGKISDEFVPDEASWKTGAEILGGAALEVLVTPGVTAEFFKVMVK